MLVNIRKNQINILTDVVKVLRVLLRWESDIIDIQLPTCINIYAMRTYTIRAIIVMMCDLYNRMLNMFGRDLDMEFMWERMEDGLIRLSVSTHRELPDGLYTPPSQKNSLLQNPLFNIFST